MPQSRVDNGVCRDETTLSQADANTRTFGQVTHARWGVVPHTMFGLTFTPGAWRRAAQDVGKRIRLPRREGFFSFKGTLKSATSCNLCAYYFWSGPCCASHAFAVNRLNYSGAMAQPARSPCAAQVRVPASVHAHTLTV